MMRSLYSFVLLALARIALSEGKTDCIAIEKGFKQELNAHKQPVCICADSGIFSTIDGFTIECESASIASVSENLASLNGTVLGRLTIRDSTVNVLPQDLFDNVFAKQVKLERCGLSTLLPKSFQSLGASLEFLSLRENRIRKLENGLFSGLKKIKTLDLAMNKIQEVDSGVFEELKHVEDLLLNENEIRELKAGIFDGLKSLKKLTLQSCGLEKIEKGAFRGLDSLEELILSNNNLENIDWSIFTSLKNLRILDLGSNRISNVELKSFLKLEKLVLNNNTIDSMKAIKLKDLPALVVALFDRNKIQSIGDMDMFGLTKSDRIETMSLAWNNLSQISSKAFQHTPNLITLLLQNNQIEELTGSKYSAAQIRIPFLAILKKLATLQLSANNLSIIRADELPKSLINLALDHNVITKIEARALEGMAIKRLYLHNNKLTYLYRGTFDSFKPTTIEAIDVSLNSWQCVCADPKEWLPSWLSEAEESDVSEGPIGCLAIPGCGQEDSGKNVDVKIFVRSGWVTVAATILTVVTIGIMAVIAILYFKDYRHQFPLRGRRSNSDLHKLIENDPLNIPSDSILVVPAMPKRNNGPKKTVRFQNF